MNNHWHQIQQILPLVSKPGRYLGNELNTQLKSPAQISISIALAYPDLYEIGMSYTGFKILYNLINRYEHFQAERVFCPWPDLIQLLENQNLPLFSLESKKPLAEFDLLGFTLQYELNYSNLIWMLHLARIPLYQSQRLSPHPLIVGGGIGVFNPEPLAPFFDFFLMGEAEELLPIVLQILADAKKSERSRLEQLKLISELNGIYVPSFYKPVYHEYGDFQHLIDLRTGKQARTISKVVIQKFDNQNWDNGDLVPLIDITHSRVAIEIMRGCSHGCRFCNAGFLYRPLREKPVEIIYQEAIQRINQTGWDEIGLLSLASCDYSQLLELLSQLNRYIEKKHITISLPSSRIDKIDIQLLKFLQGERKSGLTFAPETGSERLRRVINKDISDEQIYQAIDTVFQSGWNLIKLYFMIGLPTETDEDMALTSEMINKAFKMAQSYGRDRKINVTISPFIPKAHTPFQWEKQISSQELSRRIDILRRSTIKSDRLKISWRDEKVAWLEGVLARGDRRLAPVLEKCISQQIYFDGWSDHFVPEKWQEIFRNSNLNPESYLKARPITDHLPWEHLSPLVDQDFLRKELKKAYRGEMTQDCRVTCAKCGACSKSQSISVLSPHNSVSAEDSFQYGRRSVVIKNNGLINKHKVRIHYTKEGLMRFVSHLDTFRVFDRLMRRLQIPLAFSQGYNPHPKIMMGPPLSLGISSAFEYLDFQLDQPFQESFIQRLQANLPREMKLIQAKVIYNKTPALNASINRADYRVTFQPVLVHSLPAADPDTTSPQDENLIREIQRFNHYFSDKNTVITEYVKPWLEHWNQLSTIPCQRRRNDGTTKSMDLKSMVITIDVDENNPEPAIVIQTRLTESGSARLDEILFHLLGWPEFVCLQFKLERIGLLIEKNLDLLTPMDV